MAAYIVAICEVTNPNENFKKYAVESAELMRQHGGEYTIRGREVEVLKGEELKGKIMVISEFPSMEALKGFINDKRYLNEVAPLREGTGNYNFAVYESAPPMP